MCVGVCVCVCLCDHRCRTGAGQVDHRVGKQVADGLPKVGVQQSSHRQTLNGQECPSACLMLQGLVRGVWAFAIFLDAGRLRAVHGQSAMGDRLGHGGAS